MPGPLDALKGIASWATTPLMSKEYADQTANAYDTPTKYRSPLEAQLQGFGAGALQGLQGITSPLDLAGMASLGAGAASSAIGRMAPYAGGVVKSAAPIAQVVEEGSGVRQALPTMSEVDDIIGGMKYNLAKLGPKVQDAGAAKAMQGLSEYNPVGKAGVEDAMSQITRGATGKGPRTYIPPQELAAMRGR